MKKYIYTYDELKPQVEEMLYQIIKLVQQLDNKESYELKIELACSIITSAIDFDDSDYEFTARNLKNALNDVVDVSYSGLANVLLEKGEYKTL